MRRIVIISTLSLLEMTNYAIRKQKLCLKRDKSLRMGFCRKDPAKKKGKQTPFPPSTHAPPEIKEEAAATSLPGFSPTRCHSVLGIPAFWASPFPNP